ncbi:hypothetical protein SLEP1_g29409 [Rubroshorea leprosula]|uniref:Uncharacterized protein n=1 Tax=Rubroshorea leprosula TaxID=152421 RepID=A0AAV5K639_9ROSI|nr:hypothetical protein SLEP1_g29409 [Rubroshorea leprosula]
MGEWFPTMDAPGVVMALKLLIICLANVNMLPCFGTLLILIPTLLTIKTLTLKVGLKPMFAGRTPAILPSSWPTIFSYAVWSIWYSRIQTCA